MKGGTLWPLVGRDDELSRLSGVLDATAEGRAHTVLLHGDAGIGKTRLAQEVARLASDRGFTVVWGRGDQAEFGQSFGWLTRVLDLSPTSADEDRASLGRLLLEEPAGDTPVFAVSVPELRYRLREETTALVERLVAGAPLLLVMDDVQWVDPASRATVVNVLDRVADQRLAVVATLRGEAESSLIADAIAPIDRATRMCLRPLTSEAICVMASDVLDRPLEPWEQTELSAARGNPFLALEVLLGRERHSALQPSAGTPARIAASSQNAQLTLHVASVLGSTFTLDEVMAITGLELADATAAQREAESIGVLTTDGNRLTFRHDLVRQMVAEGLSDADRHVLHRHAGRALSQLGAPAARVARHLVLGEAAGDTSAVEWLHRAAREAGPQSPDDALDLLDEALALAHDGHDRTELLVDRVELLSWAGRLPEAEELARELLTSTQRLELRRKLRRQIALAMFVRNRAVDAAAECDASAAEQIEPAMVARALADSSLAYLTSAQMELARDRAQKAIRVGESASDMVSVSLAQSVLSRVEALSLSFTSSLERADLAIASAESDRSGEADRCQPGFFRLLTLLDLDRVDEAAEQLTVERRLAVRRGATWIVPLHHGAAAVTHLLQSELSDAATEAASGLVSAEDVGSNLASIWLHGVLALTSLGAGDLEVASAEVATMHTLIAHQPAVLGLDLMVLAEALLLDARDDPVAATALLVETCTLFHTVGIPANLRIVGLDAVRLAVATQDVRSAGEIAGMLEEVAVSTGLAADTAAAMVARGLATDDPTHLDAGVTGLAQGARTFRLWQWHEEAGKAWWWHGDKEQAALHLGRAVDLAEGAGDDFAGRRARSLFPTLGLRRPRRATKRPTTGWASLTPSEVRISDLVAAGRTNQLIANELGISRRTVESHLSHIYSKLCVQNRVELAVQAVRRSDGARVGAET